MENTSHALRIALPLDGSAAGERGLAHAVAMARIFDAKLFLLRVVNGVHDNHPPSTDCVDWQLRSRQAVSYLQQVAESIDDSNLDCETCVDSGSPSETILRFCRENDIDLLVLSRWGHGGRSELGDGAVTRKVVAATTASVLLVGGESCALSDKESLYRNILVPVNESQGAAWATSLAASIAQRHGTRVNLLRVMPASLDDMQIAETGESRELLTRIADLTETHVRNSLAALQQKIPDDVDVSTNLRYGSDAAEQIAQFASESHSDLVLLCSHGTSGLHPWRYGAVAESLLSHCDRPILVLQLDREKSAERYCHARASDARSESRVS